MHEQMSCLTYLKHHAVLRHCINATLPASENSGTLCARGQRIETHKELHAIHTFAHNRTINCCVSLHIKPPTCTCGHSRRLGAHGWCRSRSHPHSLASICMKMVWNRNDSYTPYTPLPIHKMVRAIALTSLFYG